MTSFQKGPFNVNVRGHSHVLLAKSWTETFCFFHVERRTLVSRWDGAKPTSKHNQNTDFLGIAPTKWFGHWNVDIIYGGHKKHPSGQNMDRMLAAKRDASFVDQVPFFRILHLLSPNNGMEAVWAWGLSVWEP